MPTELGFKTSRAVKGTSQPCIPKAQSWASSYIPSPTHPLLNLSQGVPGDSPHRALLKSLAETSADPKSAAYGGILGEEGLRRGMAEEAGDVHRWHERGGGERDEDETEATGEDGPQEGQAVGEGVGMEATGTTDVHEGVGVTYENVAITSGCNQALLTILMTLTDPGDNIILPCPWYFNILMSTQLLSLSVKPLPLDPENGFVPSMETARGLIDEGTKAIILVTPSNPCGTVLSPNLLEEYFELCKEKGIALVLDETNRDFIQPDPNSASPRGRPHTLFSRPDWSGTLISLMSFSKSYKIPGHRLGGMIASKEVLDQSTTVSDCMQICAPRPPQLALIPNLHLLRSDLIETSSRIHARLALFSTIISSIPGWSVASSGGFYSFVAHPYEGVPSEVVSERLAKEVGVLTLPGGWFMPDRGTKEWKALEERKSPLVADKWIRFAIANVDEEAIGRLEDRLFTLNKFMGYQGSD